MSDIIHKTEQFLEESFKARSHYSFNDWRIMVDHSMHVRDLAMQICAGMKEVDSMVVNIGALLHDIGKTTEVDEQTLREHHGELAYEVSEDFLNEMSLTSSQYEMLKNILMEKSDSPEAHVIHDADIIAFFADEQLQRALHEWATEKGISDELERKLQKSGKLFFDISKEIAVPYITEMKERWIL